MGERQRRIRWQSSVRDLPNLPHAAPARSAPTLAVHPTLARARRRRVHTQPLQRRRCRHRLVGTRQQLRPPCHTHRARRRAFAKRSHQKTGPHTHKKRAGQPFLFSEGGWTYFFFEVNPSCGRWLALARCHRGGSPRTFQRAASSPRGAQATPHPGKKNDRAPPPPASPRRAAPRLASPRLAAAHAHTHPRARARSARAKQPSKRVPNREPKGPGSNREPVRPPPLAVLAKASKAVHDIT